MATTGLSETLSGLPHPPKHNKNNHLNYTIKDSDFRTTTPSESEKSTKLPNEEGHLQCYKHPEEKIEVSTPQELPGSNPIFHQPGTFKVNSVEDLLRPYPNSFDRPGSLKEEYDIKVDPNVPLVQHVRRKVPINSKAAIKEVIDLHHSHCPTVSLV